MDSTSELMINRGLEIERLKKEIKKRKHLNSFTFVFIIFLMIIVIAEMIMFSISMHIGYNHGYDVGFKVGYESATRDFYYGKLKTDLIEENEKVMVIWKNK